MPTIKQLFFSYRLSVFFSLLLLMSLLSSCSLFGGAEPNQAEAEVEQTTAAAGQPQAGGAVGMAQTGPTVSVLPATQQIGVNETVVVEIRVANVTNLAGADVQLRFDPAILQVQDADSSKDGVQIQPGNFPAPDFVANNRVDTAAGLISYALIQLAPTPPVSGEGLIFSVTFQGIAQGISNLILESVLLSTPDAQPITATFVDSSLTVGSGDLPTPTFTPVVQDTATPTPTNTPVPGATNTPTAQATATPIAGSPTATPTVTPLPPPTSNRYVVRRGDTLFSIARRYGLSVWKLGAYNHLYNLNLIYVGQVLIIPDYGGGGSGGQYIVRRGDTLYSIARRNGYTVSQLATYNNISNPHLIYVGQVIRFP